VTVHELSRADARRIAVRAQLLGSARPAGLLDLVQRLTLLQYDQTAAVAPSADLVAWSRLGSAYSPEELAAALAARELLEIRGMIRPSEDLPLLRAEMDEWRLETRGWPETHQWIRANDAFRRDLLDRLTDGGPMTSGELPDTCAVPWKSSGWNNNRNVIIMLDCLERRGEVAVAGRRRRDRLWDLAQRVYPDDPAVPSAEAARLRNELRLTSLGIARPRTTRSPVEARDVSQAGEPAVIEGVRGQWRVDPAALGQPFSGRAALLSPLDRLVFDRKRMTEIFEFDYQLEMYKPAARRRFGYWALPVLYGDRLIGKLDATADRKAGVLRVDAIHQDVPFTAAQEAAVHDEIMDLARWLRLSPPEG
jgi:uncharacterized protein YcaQ